MPDAKDAANTASMPAATWRPHVEKTPLDPKEDSDGFDDSEDHAADDETDPRDGFTPKPF